MGVASDDDRMAGSYCPNCGSVVEESDSFCGECGHHLSGGESGQTTSDADRRQFRARIRDHINNGWEVEYDGGDEVTLVNRGYGSIGVHIILVLFTGGLGNLLYGWYHYKHTAERKVLSIHGRERNPNNQTSVAPEHSQQGTATASRQHLSSESGQHSGAQVREYYTSGNDNVSFSNYVWGLLLVVLGVAILASNWTSAVGVTAAFASLFLAALMLPPTRRRIDNRHPPTTFGPTTSVDEEFVSDCDKVCSVCFDRVGNGVKREYDQSYVFAGLPLYTMERGNNWYCESCRNEMHGLDEDDAHDDELHAVDDQAVSTPASEAVAAERADETGATENSVRADNPSQKPPETAQTERGEQTTESTAEPKETDEPATEPRTEDKPEEIEEITEAAESEETDEPKQAGESDRLEEETESS